MIMPEKIMVGLTDSEYRPCMVLAFDDMEGSYRTMKALFHKWTIEASGQGIGNISKQTCSTLALAELEDGRVAKIESEYIRFLDTKHRMDQIDWGDVGHGTENA